jgi:hypothetical protein
MLVSVFSTSLQSPANSHLRTFYLILPALSLNHVETMVSNLEQLESNRKEVDDLFAADGLALGTGEITAKNRFHGCRYRLYSSSSGTE